MATVTWSYGTPQTYAVTLTGLASAAARQGPVIDNTTTGYLDGLFRIKTNGATGGTNLLDVYVYSSSGDAVYTDGATGTDAAFTAANRLNARYLGSVQMNAATGVIAMLGGIAAAFGGVMPAKFGLIFINNSGAALSSTAADHEVIFQGLTQTIA
jgi:hypothetical protein